MATAENLHYLSPGSSCTFKLVPYRKMFLAYMIAPLALASLLLLPLLMLAVLGWIRHRNIRAHPGFTACLRRCLRAFLFLLFIIYPTVSVKVLGYFNCDYQVLTLRRAKRVNRRDDERKCKLNNVVQIPGI